jgi:hypothetical protein
MVAMKQEKITSNKCLPREFSTSLKLPSALGSKKEN